MTNILLIGHGAREHVIAETFRKNKDAKLYSFMKSKNPGISLLSKSIELGSYSDLEKIKKFASENEIDFAFIGPEEPLSFGAVDALEHEGINAVGPTKLMARLETSKSFTRELLQKYNIDGNPNFKVFSKNNFDELKYFMNELEEVVVKPDGLTGGKGVKVQGDHFNTKKEALDYCKEVLETHPAVIIEEKLGGEEFSLQCLTDGKTVIATPPVQDHKRAFDDDKGPNCYSEDTEILTKERWKKFSDLKKEDKVMIYDPKWKIIQFQKPEKIYWMRYKGGMVSFKNRDIDLLVTPNHRMLLQRRKRKKEFFVMEAKNYKGENYILQSAKWNGKPKKYFRLPLYKKHFNFKSIRVEFKKWVKFLALYLAEGYASIDKNGGGRVYICQSQRSKHFSAFKNILKAMPFKFTYEKNKFRINSIQLATYLKEFGLSLEKYVPEYVKNSDKKTILDFLKAFCLGDGDVHYGRMRFHSGSKQIIDDIQEMILKIGCTGVICTDKRKKMANPINKKVYKANPVYSIEIKPKNKTAIRKSLKHINRKLYNGYVGCVTVPTGFVVIRRNGRVAICGNTGGMGSYSCENHLLPFLKKEHVGKALEITKKVAKAINEETGLYYKGVMYGGFILTKNGVKLIEYNARFGDPEAMNVLPLLKTDLAGICQAIITQELGRIKVEFEKKSTVCKYVVPNGYPDNPVKNEKVEIQKIPEKARMYYASVKQKEDGLYMTGSRAIAFLGIGDNLEEAEEIAEEAVSCAKGKVFYRKDIGTKALIGKRVEHIKRVLG